MNTLENIRTRRSVKKYNGEPVSRDLIEKIVEAGTYAANGRGAQSPIIIAVTNKELRDRLAYLNQAVIGGGRGGDSFYGAPAVLVVLADKSVPTYVYDGSLVLGNMMLAAHELGVSSCWIHRAKQVFESEEGKEILKELGIEGDYEGVGNLIIGYPDGPIPEARPRKENWVYYAE